MVPYHTFFWKKMANFAKSGYFENSLAKFAKNEKWQNPEINKKILFLKPKIVKQKLKS